MNKQPQSAQPQPKQKPALPKLAPVAKQSFRFRSYLRALRAR